MRARHCKNQAPVVLSSTSDPKVARRFKVTYVDVASGRKDLASDDVFELGGTWISSDHTAVLGLCEELKLELYHASFLDRDRKNEAVGSSTNGNTDTVDWPWWFWGVDYSSEEMERIHKLVLHTNNNKDEPSIEKE